jgi:hypothetical protein
MGQRLERLAGSGVVSASFLSFLNFVLFIYTFFPYSEIPLFLLSVIPASQDVFNPVYPVSCLLTSASPAIEDLVSSNNLTPSATPMGERRNIWE